MNLSEESKDSPTVEEGHEGCVNPPRNGPDRDLSSSLHGGEAGAGLEAREQLAVPRGSSKGLQHLPTQWGLQGTGNETPGLHVNRAFACR